MNPANQLKRWFVSMLLILLISEGYSYKISGRFVREKSDENVCIQFLISDGKNFSENYISDLDKGFLIKGLEPGRYFIRYVNNYYQGFEIPVHIIDKNILNVVIPYQEFDYDLNPLKMTIETIDVGELIQYKEKYYSQATINVIRESKGYRVSFFSTDSPVRVKYFSLSELKPLIDLEERIQRISYINRQIPNPWPCLFHLGSTKAYSILSPILLVETEIRYCTDPPYSGPFQGIIKELFPEDGN